MPIDELEWIVPEVFESRFKWEYEDGSESLHRLYEKGKKQQWNASDRIDWSLDLDPENPKNCLTSIFRFMGLRSGSD